MDTEYKKRTTMRLPKIVMDNLDDEASSMGWSRSTLVLQVLAKYLAEQGRPTNIRVIL